MFSTKISRSQTFADLEILNKLSWSYQDRREVAIEKEYLRISQLAEDHIFIPMIDLIFKRINTREEPIINRNTSKKNYDQIIPTIL